MLRSGEIRVRAKIGNDWLNWIEVDYETWKTLSSDKKYALQIKSTNDERSWRQLKNQGNLQIKTLFPEDRTEEMIAEAFKKVESRIKKVLLEDYWLPKYSPENASKYWKNIKWKEIKIRVSINWKEIELEIWWKYDNEWKLDFTIQTIYPSNLTQKEKKNHQLLEKDNF